VDRQDQDAPGQEPDEGRAEWEPVTDAGSDDTTQTMTWAWDFGEVFFDHDLSVYGSYLVLIAAYFFLYRNRRGLELPSISSMVK